MAMQSTAVEVVTADIFDAYHTLVSVCEAQFRSFGKRKSLVGECETLKVFEDHTPVLEALQRPGRERILIVDAGGSLRVGVLGDRLAAIGVRNGWSGAVVFGAVRDSNGIDAMDFGVKALYSGADMSKGEEIAAMIAEMGAAMGGIDILVNNAANYETVEFEEITLKQWDAIFASNTRGPFLVSREALKHLRERRGKIINISSVSGEKGGRGQTNYAASKGALNAFTRSLAVELAPRGITVNAVAPGVIDTELSRAVRERAADQALSRILLRRFGRPEEVAYAVWFLASRYADYITGQILNVDGGFKME